MARPRYKVTDDQRKAVEKMAAIRMTEESMASILTMDAKTLRKYFRVELARGAAKGEVSVKQTGFEMATDGKHPGMTKFYIERMLKKEANRVAATAEPPVPLEDARARLAVLFNRRAIALQAQREARPDDQGADQAQTALPARNKAEADRPEGDPVKRTGIPDSDKRKVA
jgi:hypothetical protein